MESLAVLDSPMAKKAARTSDKRKDEAVRIDSDVVDAVRAVTGFNKMSIGQYISETLRPIVRKDLERFARQVLKGQDGTKEN